MAECARCNAFTDNPAEGKYHYCDDCLAEFEEIRTTGVVVEPVGRSDGYHVQLPRKFDGYESGQESNQADAIARGKWLCDELGLDGLFVYHETRSTWPLDEYLRAHPLVRRDALDRVRRVPSSPRPSFLTRLRNKF